MTEREKVIKGLECHKRAMYGEVDEHGLACNTCPYKDMESTCHTTTERQLIEDVLALLKAQEPRVMTFEELHNYVGKQLGVVMQNEDDWRPAGDMYIKDIVKVIDGVYTTIPNGIRIWLKNGDSIIYVKAQVETNDPN